ncbi:MAG TPA: tRNA uridine-5-carboxymethylaminomethyl(34) synthesis GTPase MnmE [Chitinophagales bacterium]|nr:tRNA uridine-5-carboxymethylaminomethyl(34) synthesis GTPase MnmE [Chitinophagales bacterium]
MISTDTIVALATPAGVGAIGVIRLSGNDAIAVAGKVFKGKDLTQQPSHTIHYGHIVDGDKIIDEVMVSLFRAPKSFTTEDVVEISCHGSPFIAEQVLRVLIQNGARSAKPGEFTLRAFMHGRIDLSQAEAVADIIASNSAASLDLALKQMRGGFSNDIKILRGELVNFASLIELELDFAEEDVEFADRKKLIELIELIQSKLRPLIESFRLGNVIKHGVNTVIAGKPNAGKSTLLNALLNEERAIVSDIPGTTRDTIEEVLNIRGIQFRFIDTAGIRSTVDVIEKMGVEKTMEKLKQSSIYIYLFDVNTTTPEELLQEVKQLELTNFTGLIVGNKIDSAHWQDTAPFYWILKNSPATAHLNLHDQLHFISAKTNMHTDQLKDKLYVLATANLQPDNTIVTNTRHYEALMKANAALNEVKAGVTNQNTGELTSLDIKRALEHLGEISGEVTNDEILGNIFSKFCIGK